MRRSVMCPLPADGPLPLRRFVNMYHRPSTGHPSEVVVRMERPNGRERYAMTFIVSRTWPRKAIADKLRALRYQLHKRLGVIR